jgi:hypothetical protein
MLPHLKETLGFVPESSAESRSEQRQDVIRYLVLKLLANGLPHPPLLEVRAGSLQPEQLIGTYHERLKLLDEVRCPADQRIEKFLSDHFFDTDLESPLTLPDRSIILDQHGLSRELSLPIDSDSYSDANVSSYRVRNGVLHNPLNDRRTTSGTFHVTDGGLPIPRDKFVVPKTTFAALFQLALDPPEELLELPFTSECDVTARSFVSLLLRPLVCPEVPGVCTEKRMEIRFFAPGTLVSNLDFVESIFGNAGDPYLPENDAGLDVEHWSGQTGCVILAPHLTTATKKQVGLPHIDDATLRQREDGMCWESEDELYNGGSPFKLTCRTAEGVIVTLIADNYFGYCKKEVKTQISYAANLYGNVEEEHAGGAIAFPSFNLGNKFNADSRRYNNRTFDDVVRDYSAQMDVFPEGYAVDRLWPNLVYVPENAHATVIEQRIWWDREGHEHSIPLHPEHVYMTPSGYKLKLDKHPAAPTWRLIGTLSEGVFCHKPCTVSGGGKSEISKSIADYILHGSVFVNDLENDFDQVQEIFDRDYTDRWREGGSVQPDYSKQPARKVLDPQRTLGSVIKLLTPSVDYTDEYNAWLESIPGDIYALVFAIKRFHSGDEDFDWRTRFSVDIVNGMPGHELKIGDRKIVADYLRVGLHGEKAWRTYRLRQDFAAAQKIQTEDDISASVVVPASRLDYLGKYSPPAASYKFVENCEFRLFQRPDDAIHRGLDKQTEADLARRDNFIVNFEPLSREKVEEICDRPIDLSTFTEPMQQLLLQSKEAHDEFVVCSATPRRIGDRVSKNPRYLQTRPDVMQPFHRYVAEMGVRLFRAVPADSPVRIPVHAVLLGRRNNPADYEKGFRPLAVYNPIHYQELPELFMDFISSLTGKSPSTTGAGSEGALTKGPFNALTPITDLNNALVSYLLTGLDGFSTPAGHIGSDVRVDHDISLLIPEIWCRLSPEERDARFLIEEDLLEKVDNFEYDGKSIPASRLGYRITSRFIRRFVGRVFDNPGKVFEENILKPELQDAAAFADGILFIAEAHERVARNYFEDGSVEQACPPLKALLHVMAYGSWEGHDATSPEFRELFTLKNMLDSDWYRRRLATQQKNDVTLWTRHVEYLSKVCSQNESAESEDGLELNRRLQFAQNELKRVAASEYLTELWGMLGSDSL